MKRRYRRIIYLLLFLLLFIFMLANIIWYKNYSMYNSYIKDYQKFRTCYNKAEEKYDLTVKKPSYASLTGNFAIVNKPQTLTLIIWPGIFMERPFEYGVIIYDKESKNQCMIYVDENMNYLEDKNSGYSQTQIESEKNILNKNLQEVRALYEIAKNEWNL